MLQRAASNACSWWWSSHIRTKQSKWLEQNLQDMEEKVNMMMRIIEGDGDSFAERAEMYYRKRPELVEQVEESYRQYRSLAERFDHLSKELQGANRTIASIFPERVQYSIDDDDNFSQEPFYANNHPEHSSSFLVRTPKSGIPQVPKFPEKSFRSLSIVRKAQAQLSRKVSTVKSTAATTMVSGLSETEALDEIDKLQKEILARQTEMEFVKSLYERHHKKYWEIENLITAMHKRVSNLQDEFGICTVIEDNEARTLMAETALKSCQGTLNKLQEEQEQTAEEAKLENDRIKQVNAKFETLKSKVLSKQTGHHMISNVPEGLSANQELIISDQQLVTMGDERQNMKGSGKEIREQLEVNSNSTLTVSELAERIDELVSKVVTLESAVSSQTTLVKRLKSETDVLQENVQTLEEDKEFLMESSESMSQKLKQMEEEIARVKNLNRNLEMQNNHLQTHFTEASCNLNHISDKLQNVKLVEEAENTVSLQDVLDVYNANTSEEQKDEQALDTDVPFSTKSELEQRKDSLEFGDFDIDEEEKLTSLCENLSPEIEKPNEPQQEGENGIPQPEAEAAGDHLELDELGSEVAGKQLTLRQLFLKGLEDRERLLLEEYTSVLRDYKDVRNKLSEVEQKNRDSIFELAMQVKELKDAISSKDDVIKSLVSNPNSDLDTNAAADVDQGPSQEIISEAASSLYSVFPSPSLDHVSSPESFGEQSIGATERSYKLSRNFIILPTKEDENRKANGVDKTNTLSSIEERFRSDIDGLLEANLEFWLRFSTSVHQIQKFQTSIRDLQVELQVELHKQKENNKKQGDNVQKSIQSSIRPIYRHLREIQTELTLWLEHNTILKDELRSRFTSLSNIQNEIAIATDAHAHECSAATARKTGMSEYQAAKFQGEVINMKQENRKIAEELQVGHSRVRGMQVQVNKTLENLDREYGVSPIKTLQSTVKQSINRARIPLRSFLFGVKLRRQKPSSIFSCATPAFQKSYCELASRALPRIQ